METNNQLEKQNSEIIIQKRAAWADVGEVIHTTELKLKAQSEAILATLIEPKSIEGIAASEAALTEAKKQANALIAERKLTTDPLATVASRLMQHEKMLLNKFPEIEKQLISLKQQKKAADDLANATAEEKKQLREICALHITNTDIIFRQVIEKQVDFAFSYALGVGCIDEAGLKDYLAKVKLKYTVENFTTPAPTVTLKNVPKAEFEVIWGQNVVSVKPAETYINLYLTTLEKKFEFYNVSLMNKKAAIEASEKATAEAAANLAKEQKSGEIAAALNSMATSIEAAPQSKVKDLKTVYVLDMEETEQNALLIIAAFVANFENTKQYVKSGWFNLKVEQMGKALVSLKNKDNKFSCTGIIFKTEDKLK